MYCTCIHHVSVVVIVIAVVVLIFVPVFIIVFEIVIRVGAIIPLVSAVGGARVMIRPVISGVEIITPRWFRRSGRRFGSGRIMGIMEVRGFGGIRRSRSRWFAGMGRRLRNRRPPWFIRRPRGRRGCRFSG